MEQSRDSLGPATAILQKGRWHDRIRHRNKATFAGTFPCHWHASAQLCSLVFLSCFGNFGYYRLLACEHSGPNLYRSSNSSIRPKKHSAQCKVPEVARLTLPRLDPLNASSFTNFALMVSTRERLAGSDSLQSYESVYIFILNPLRQLELQSEMARYYGSIRDQPDESFFYAHLRGIWPFPVKKWSSIFNTEYLDVWGFLE